MPKYVQFLHHGRMVTANKKLSGMHREHCLCYDCSKFDPNNQAKNCPIAAAVFKLDQKHGITTPVYECPEFQEQQHG